jgi:hypothetical protein
MFIAVSPVVAATFKEYWSASALESAFNCKNPDTCLGSCSCGIKANPSWSLSRDITFTIYDAVNQYTIFSVFDRSFFAANGSAPSNYYYGAVFTSGGSGANGCGISFVALPGTPDDAKSPAGAPQTASLQQANNDVKPLYGSQFCKYNDPFCCCTDGGGGHFADCKRGVEYSDPLRAPQPTCQSFGDKYKPITDAAFPKYASLLQKGGGCKLFLEAANRDQDKKKDLSQTPYEVPTQSNINLLDEARSLNQTRFTTLTQVIGQVIKLLLAFIGSIALALYIWSGILWMTAAGSSERIQQAKGILIWTTLGVVMMLTSALVVSFIFGILTN